MTDEDLMRRAIELALRGTGRVSPNPRVGAVIVKDGEIIGEGYHSIYGGEHAEISAIKNASTQDFDSATIYINLEPCSHQGKTPPCAPIIIEKKFKKVVIGMADPNPEVSGKGIEKLKQAGIEVVEGILKDECKWLNRFFIKNITTKTPYIILKSAISLDGFISTRKGESKWISSEESRIRTHILRSTCDGVLIGKTTAITDNPQLNVRHIQGRNPKRIVLDTQLSLPLELNLFTDNGRDDTIIICTDEFSESKKAETLKMAGIKILAVRKDRDGKIDLVDAMHKLSSEYNIASIMVEGGSSVFSSFIRDKLFDELQLFIAPIILGKGLNVFANYEAVNISNAMNLNIKALSKSGNDIHLVATKTN